MPGPILGKNILPDFLHTGRLLVSNYKKLPKKIIIEFY